jgi:hypothetical protein
MNDYNLDKFQIFNLLFHNYLFFNFIIFVIFVIFKNIYFI